MLSLLLSSKVKFKASFSITIGIVENIFCSYFSICLLKPFDKDKTRAIPIIPIDDARDVKIVLPFFVLILENDNFNESINFIFVFIIFIFSSVSSLL